MNMRVVFGGLALVFLSMIAVYFWFSGNVAAAVVAAIVMAITGFFFAAVSGNLVGMIGSSNNPISGLTLSTLLIAALLMVAIGVEGKSGVAAVLGVASIVCISSAVAGEMLQDLKVGHLLGGTPSKMQWGDILGIVIAGSVMFFPLLVLHQANITAGGTGFGDPELSAPQAGLMAAIAQGVVGGEMAWPLIIVGILMGLGFVLLKVRSPMLVSVGMYLPLETTFAIFCGGIIRWLSDKIAARRQLNAAQRTRTDNAGVLVASGLIAGEALMGLGIAALRLLQPATDFPGVDIGSVADWLAPLVLLALAVYMIVRPLRAPAPPTSRRRPAPLCNVTVRRSNHDAQNANLSSCRRNAARSRNPPVSRIPDTKRNIPCRVLLLRLQPSVLWKHFDALRRIPRPSGHEEAVMAHLRSWAEARGLAHRSDAVGNLVIYVPGTKGREKAPAVILQGHVDMVAEKDKSTDFDFLKDPIEVVVEGDWVVAPKTTLGADNGIGVAAAQAVADDPAVSHGPLELLFTVDEETALTGATNLDGSLLTGRTMLNLDSEEDGTLFVGCAGGCTTDLVFDLSPSASPQGWTELEINVTGLKGGHSGLAIHENRGNAIKILAELLSRTLARGPVRLVRIEGGNKHNAIPREASAGNRRPGRFGSRRRGIGGGRRPRHAPGNRRNRSGPADRGPPGRRARSQRLRDHDHAPGAPVAGLAARRVGHEPRHPGPGRDLDESRRGLDRRRPGRDRHLQPFLRGPGLAQGPGPDSRRRGAWRRRRLRAQRLPGMATQHGLAAVGAVPLDLEAVARHRGPRDGRPRRPRVRDHQREARRRRGHDFLWSLAGRRARSRREGQLEDGPAFLRLPQCRTGSLQFLAKEPRADNLAGVGPITVHGDCFDFRGEASENGTVPLGRGRQAFFSAQSGPKDEPVPDL